MQAIVVNKYGSALELEKAQMPDPKPQADEVLVSVRAFSVNPMDIGGRTGQMGEIFGVKWELPVILGWDFAGTVVSVGANVSGFKNGDEVFGELDAVRPDKNGAYAELVAIKSTNLAHKPADLSFEEAAALPIAGLTAWHAINDKLHVQKGDHVLIQGGAGGVGHIALQLAKHAGAYVAVTASQEHQSLLSKLGADQVIDYHTDFVGNVLHDFDKVFDTVGDIAGGLSVLKPAGKLITINGSAQLTEEQKNASQKPEFMTSYPAPESLTALGKLVASDQVRVIVANYPFTTQGIQAAHQEIQSGHTTGKIVIHLPKNK